MLTFRQLAGLLCCPPREDLGENTLPLGTWLASRSPWGPSGPSSSLHTWGKEATIMSQACLALQALSRRVATRDSEHRDPMRGES